MGEEFINLRVLIVRAIQRWYFFAAALFVSLGIAMFSIKTTAPVYKSSAVFLFKDDQKNASDEEALFADLGTLLGYQKLDNEIRILRSSPLMREVVKNLGLQYQYDRVGNLRTHPLYRTSPVEVLSWESNSGSDLTATIELDGKGGYLLTTDEYSRSAEFGKPVSLPEGKLALRYIQDRAQEGPFKITIRSIGATAGRLASKLDINGSEDGRSSIINLSIEDESQKRGREILDELMKVYVEQSIKDKETIYQNSIDLLDERIKLVSAELSASEQNLESYKRRFNSIELGAEGSFLMKDLSSFNQKITNIDVQMEILDSIQHFLVQHQKDFEFVPTNPTITNLTLATQLKSFNDLLTERTRLRAQLGPSHPDLLLTERQIQNLRETIIENIRSIKQDLVITKKANDDLRGTIQTRLSSLPKQERDLFEMERQKDIKENLYLYLLQKREEAIISLSIITSNGKVVEPAYSNSSPDSPKKKLIIAVACFMGLIIPLGVIYLLEILNDKIQLEDKLEELTSVPVGGMIPFKTQKKGMLVLSKTSRNAISEMFRLLRTNLAYLRPGRDIQSLIVTSGSPNEGKSFIAVNLGVAQSLSGKKTVVLELDLRHPKVREYFGVEEGRKGIVDYLIDPNLTLDDIIHPSDDFEGLDIITSGPIPPNPGDIILVPRLRALIRDLRKRYDFIIMDTPPIGLVSDPFQLSDLADATLFVVRVGRTRKSQLKVIEDVSKNRKMPYPFIVLNGVKLNRASYQYGYGYNPGKYYDQV